MWRKGREKLPYFYDIDTREKGEREINPGPGGGAPYTNFPMNSRSPLGPLGYFKLQSHFLLHKNACKVC